MSANSNKRSFMNANPIMKGLGKMNENVSTAESETASYNGVLKKTAFFVILTIVGYILYNFVERYVLANIFQSIEAGVSDDFALTFSIGSIVIMIVSLILCIICPIVAYRSPRLAPVFGGIYSVMQGFLISSVISSATSSGRLAEIGAETIALFVFAATGLVVFFMGFLYKRRILKATGKFRMIIISAAGVSILLSLAVFVLSLIPATAPIVAVFVTNPVVSILCSVIGLVIASLFLISDFDIIEQTVVNGLDKKYEWTAAFGLVMTMIWIYLKILQIVIEIFGNRD